MSFASGKIALAICDICGFECLYNELKSLIRDDHDTGLLVCQDCFDPDHPQNDIEHVITSDAIGLKDPRPDTPRVRGFFGWNPVGNESDIITGHVGSVTITTS